MKLKTRTNQPVEDNYDNKILSDISYNENTDTIIVDKNLTSSGLITGDTVTANEIAQTYNSKYFKVEARSLTPRTFTDEETGTSIVVHDSVIKCSVIGDTLHATAVQNITTSSSITRAMLQKLFGWDAYNFYITLPPSIMEKITDVPNGYFGCGLAYYQRGLYDFNYPVPYAIEKEGEKAIKLAIYFNSYGSETDVIMHGNYTWTIRVEGTILLTNNLNTKV